MNPSSLRVLILVMICGSAAGCNNDPNNPKMPDIPPAQIKTDAAVPKAVGESKQPYGASKKYQDMMNH